MFSLNDAKVLQSKKGIFLIFLIASLVSPPVVLAEKVNKLFEIKQKIRNAWDSIDESKEEETSIRTNIQNVNRTINKKEKELKNYERQMSHTQEGIINLQNDIDMLNAELESRKPYLKEYINFLHKHQVRDNTLVIVSATDFQDLARRSKNISLLANYEGRVIEKYIKDIQEIKTKQKDLENIIAELEASKEEARNKKKELQDNLSKKNEMLNSVREKQMAYEKKIKELENSSQKIQGMVATLEKKSIPEAITGSGFASLKNRLPWPIDGKVLLPYGEYKDPVYNVSAFNNGIHIEADPGDVPKAVAGGRVIYANTFEGYGKLLIIDHGNGYNTLYGNLSEIQLEKGNLLIKGTELGKITRSKLLNTPALYFEIRYNGKSLNTMEWLEKQG